MRDRSHHIYRSLQQVLLHKFIWPHFSLLPFKTEAVNCMIRAVSQWGEIISNGKFLFLFIHLRFNDLSMKHTQN